MNKLRFVAILVFTLALASCTAVEELPDVIETVAVPTPPEPEPEEELPPGIPAGMGINPLTGEYMPLAAIMRRPAAIVINNLRQALPQSGISQADILYEVLAEGGITRFVGIFHNFEATQIGPVRSARSYFLDFAQDHDAIFVHHGASPAAYEDLFRMNVDRIDGMVHAPPFWRDQERVRRGLYEHSSYTSYSRIWDSVSSRNLRHDAAPQTPFSFFPVPSSPREAESALEFEVRFSQSYFSRFVFDEETRLYHMSAFQGDVMDEYTDKQLTFTNIIVQLTDISPIPGDGEGRQNVRTIGNGSGFLFTNGSVSPISWQKPSRTEPTQWLNAQGLPLNINKGRTYIAVHNIPPTIFTNLENEEESTT